MYNKTYQTPVTLQLSYSIYISSEILYKKRSRREFPQFYLTIKKQLHLFMKHFIYLVTVIYLLCSCSKDSETEDLLAKPTKVYFTANLSAIQESLMLNTRNDSKLKNLRAYMVTNDGVYIGYQDGVVKADKSSATIECEIPASYFGRTIDFYCIGNPDMLSNELAFKPDDKINKTDLQDLYTTSNLQTGVSFVMGAHMSFVANGDSHIQIPLSVRRTMSKLYVVPANGITATEQAKLKVESIRIVNGSSAGYLFKNEMVSHKQDRIESVIINKTVNQLGVNSPLCYLYPVSNIATIPSDGTEPVSDGKFYLEITTSYNGQPAVKKYKAFTVERNKKYKITYSLPASGNAGFDITITEWEEDTDVGTIG